ncbi:uncharacterized protein BDV14DRAFT_77491 [Aspergillus stella-maris]|uniref:uncharacterized protein n=1 Tax=Aspergillus stella-maris TaxID=1810926 RepID=UPI003CCDC9A0
MASQETIRIGYVPEHYLAPLHLALRTPAIHALPYKIALTPFPSGTGHMITSLRSNEIDIAIGLTEGWVAGLAGKTAPASESERGYKVVGHWVDTPLRWAIVTGRNRDELNGVKDLEGKRVGVSRLGSGSHIMSFVLAQEQGWQGKGKGGGDLEPVVTGPFGPLRDGVSGNNLPEGKATSEFFMWEHFTTKPFFHAPDSPLKKIGEIFTPWPSWLITASSSVFPEPETDERLAKLFGVLDEGVNQFNADTGAVVKMLGTGELGCNYGEKDASEWIKDVKFAEGVRGVDGEVIGKVVDVLKVAGVIDQGLERSEAIDRVIGIKRS